MLWRRHLLHIDTGYCTPACPGVSITITSAATDPEFHFHLPLRDIFADAFNLTDTTFSHVDETFDGRWRAALGTIKGKEPPLTAVFAIADAQYAIEINAQASVIRIFLEITLLGEFKVNKDNSERILQNLMSLITLVVIYLECWKRI